MNKQEQISTNINKYKQISPHMNKYENRYKQISSHMDKYEQNTYKYDHKIASKSTTNYQISDNCYENQQNQPNSISSDIQ